MFISNAFAQTAEAATSTAASFTNFIPLILIFVIFYFLLVRPQQKRMKEHQNLLGQLKNGDKVHTSSGIFGTVRGIDEKENTVELEIADGVVIKMIKQNISDVLNKKDKNNETKK